MNGLKTKSSLLLWLIVVVLAGLSCQTITGAPRPTPIPTWTGQAPTASSLSTPVPEASGIPATIPTATEAESSPQTLAACPLDLQSRSMLAVTEPDWKKTGISACYNLDLDLAADGSTYTGSEKLSFTNFTGAPLNELVLRTYPNATVIYSGKLEVTEARIDGKAVEPEVFLKDRTGLRLPLASPLAPDTTAQVELKFQGQPSTDFNPGGGYGIFKRTVLDNGKGSVVTLANSYPILAQWKDGKWVASEVIGGGDAVVSTISLYQASIHVPTGWKVAASGSETGTRNEGGKTVYEFATGPVREFMLATSPAFEARQGKSGDVTITHWGLPGTEKGWDEALKVAQNSVDLYDQRFGKYPYKELDVVSVPLQYASGVEYPGLVLIETGQYGQSRQPGFTLATVVAHEVAHQWWYGVVGSDILQDPFQDEALATYSELVYAQKYSRVVYQTELTFYKTAVKSVEDQHGKEAVDQSVAAFNGDDNLYAVIVYLKGALFFQALRDQLGDDTFFAALHTYFVHNAFKTADVPALRDSFEQTCRCSLDPIFQNYGVGK